MFSPALIMSICALVAAVMALSIVAKWKVRRCIQKIKSDPTIADNMPRSQSQRMFGRNKRRGNVDSSTGALNEEPGVSFNLNRDAEEGEVRVDREAVVE